MHSIPSARSGFVSPWILVALLVAALAGLFLQQRAINRLRAETEELNAKVVASMGAAGQEDAGRLDSLKDAELDRLRKDNAELNRLRNEVRQLREASAKLSALEQENLKLRSASQELSQQKAAAESQLAQAQASADDMAAQQQALSEGCINRLKRIVLAARLWANNNQGILPENFVMMQNELLDPRLLVCPADFGRPVAQDWAAWQPGNASYQMLPPGPAVQNPVAPYVTCPLHGHVGMVDGSVQAAQRPAP